MDRYEIINNYGKLEFEEFLKSNNILELLNEEGLKILSESLRKEERIDYILAFSPDVNRLFKNDMFINIFLSSKISYFSINLEKLDKNSVEILIQKQIELGKTNEDIAKIFGYFDEEIKKEILQSKTLPIDVVYEIFKNGRITDKAIILENYDINLTSHDINIYNIFYNAKHARLVNLKNKNLGTRELETISIPSHLITNELAEKIWDDYDIFAIREIINIAEYSCNPEILNKYTKAREEKLIQLGTTGTLIPPLDELYECYTKYREIEEYMYTNSNQINDAEYEQLYKEYQDTKRKYINHKYIENNKKIYEKLEKSYRENGLSRIVEVFEEENHKLLSNYIIDYHFEENYHNIKLDVDELLSFYFRGNIDLPEEFISIYQRVSNIDFLSFEEKLELHEEMKQYNMIERFYDDMAFARHIVRETIKDYSLTTESIKQYLDENLTKKYGVNVYNVKNEPFFGIVKSGVRAPDTLPTGHSYSLIGNNCVSIFGNPEDANTYLYDAEDLNPDQIVHVYPKDSFTLYRPYDGVEEASYHINTLLTAPELISASTGYNEILILEQGTKPMEVDKNIQALKRIAIYCLDEIKEKDIERANATGLGILLVSAKSYNHDFETRDRISNIDYWEYKYFNGTIAKDKYEEKRSL